MLWKILGLLVILAGIFVGVYVGLWLCLVGGIVCLVEAIKADPVSSRGIAYGIARIVLTGFAGGMSFFICLVLGLGLREIGDD